MSRHGYDKKPSSANFRRSSASLPGLGLVISGYLSGRVNRTETVRQMKHSGLRGSLYAGELILEQAIKTPDIMQASELYAEANELFLSVENTSRLSQAKDAEMCRARSIVMRAYLPALSYMAISHSLPPASKAETLYKTTVTTAKELDDDYHSSRDAGHRAKMNGFMSELVVLALLQRYAIKRAASDTFLPVLATFSSDRRNTSGSTINHSWDLEVHTDDGSGPVLAHKIQVKSMSADCLGDNVDGITYVGVDPDLALHNNEHYLATHIIWECLGEQSADQQSSARLDRREQLLFQQLG